MGTKLGLATSLVVAPRDRRSSARPTDAPRERANRLRKGARGADGGGPRRPVAAPLEFDDPQADVGGAAAAGGQPRGHLRRVRVGATGTLLPEGEIGVRTASDGAPNPRALAAPILAKEVRTASDEIRSWSQSRSAAPWGSPSGTSRSTFSLAAENATFEASKTRYPPHGLIVPGRSALVLTLVAISRRTIVRVARPPRRGGQARRGRGDDGGGGRRRERRERGRLGDRVQSSWRRRSAIGSGASRAALQALEAKDAIITEDLGASASLPAEAPAAPFPPVGRVCASRCSCLEPTGARRGGHLRRLRARPGRLSHFPRRHDRPRRPSLAPYDVVAPDGVRLAEALPDGPARVLERLNEKLTASYPDLGAPLQRPLPGRHRPAATAPSSSSYANAAHPPFLHAPAERDGRGALRARPFLGRLRVEIAHDS